MVSINQPKRETGGKAMRKFMSRAVVPDIDGGLYDLPDRNGVGGSDRAGTGGSPREDGNLEAEHGSIMDSSGAVRTDGSRQQEGWYYLDPGNGSLRTGWQNIGGHIFYLNTAQDGVEGKMRTGWFQDPSGHRYF